MGTACPCTRNAGSVCLALHGAKPHTKWVSPALLLNKTDPRGWALALRRGGTAWLVSMDLFSPKQSSLVQTAYLGKSTVCANLFRVPRHCVGDGELLRAKTLPGGVLRINQHGQLRIRAQTLTLALVYFPVQSAGTRVAPAKPPGLFALCRCEFTFSRALQWGELALTAFWVNTVSFCSHWELKASLVTMLACCFDWINSAEFQSLLLLAQGWEKGVIKASFWP